MQIYVKSVAIILNVTEIVGYGGELKLLNLGQG